MKNIIAYIKDGGQLVKAETHKNFCGFYAGIQQNAANGWNDRNTNAGDLYAVMCGPQLWPCYDESGHRLNVGADRAGMSYDSRRGRWYYE